MYIDRYDKNGTQIQLDDYLLRADGGIYKVIFNLTLLSIGIVDADETFFFMDNWIKEEWEVKTYDELFNSNDSIENYIEVLGEAV